MGIRATRRACEAAHRHLNDRSVSSDQCQDDDKDGQGRGHIQSLQFIWQGKSATQFNGLEIFCLFARSLVTFKLHERDSGKIIARRRRLGRRFAIGCLSTRGAIAG